MNITDVRAYFKTLAENHSEVKSFNYGGADRILERLKNKITYPAVWFVEPDFNYKDSGGLSKKYSTDLLVLTKPTSDKDVDVDFAKDKAEEILHELLKRIDFDVENENTDIEFEFNNIEGGYKDNYSSDKDVGAFIAITFSLPQDECLDKLKWKDL
jgi:hypothetical protein